MCNLSTKASNASNPILPSTQHNFSTFLQHLYSRPLTYDTYLNTKLYSITKLSIIYCRAVRTEYLKLPHCKATLQTILKISGHKQYYASMIYTFTFSRCLFASNLISETLNLISVYVYITVSDK